MATLLSITSTSTTNFWKTSDTHFPKPAAKSSSNLVTKRTTLTMTTATPKSPP